MINRKIAYFTTLAECLSFTQAAARHGVSQTAISQYIASLEERLGVRLFERSPHAVSLTEAGRYYYDQVCGILQTYDAARTRLKAIAEQYHGYVRVGIGVYEYCSTERFFSRFLKLHPEIKVDIFQYEYSVLAEKLRTGELDVILGDELCEEAFGRKEILTRPFLRSPNYLVADPAVAARYGAGDAAAILRGECLITNCEDSGPSSLEMLRRLLLREYGFLPERISQTNSVNAQLMLVRACHGVAIVPGFVVDEQGAGLEKLPLPGGEIVSYKLIRLAACANPAADLLFQFQIEG